MNMNSFYKYVWVLLTALFIASCSLDEYNPVAVSEDSELSNFTGWEAYQSNCYTGLFGNLIGMQYGLVSECGTDLWTYPYGSANAIRQLLAYQEFTTSSSAHVRNVWNYCWGPIKDCNKTIELASQLTDGNATDITVLTAEARFLRAYYYSVLVAHFGELPLVLSSLENSLTPTRNSVDEIYDQIVSDLRFAFNNLGLTPYKNNPGRVDKKAAFGILARVYAQGAGEGLSEGGKSYWVRAKEVADSIINNPSAYGAALYDDFAKVFASANNRNNAEALFTAYGADPYGTSWSYYRGGNPNLWLHFYPKFDDAFGAGTDVFKRGVNANQSNAYYGRCNQQFVAPTKYLLDCFDARYDKRWENTFVTALTNYSGVQAIASHGSSTPRTPSWAEITYEQATVTINEAICTKYGIDPSHIGKTIYPYADVDVSYASQNSNWQHIPMIWNKGAHSGDLAELTEHPISANVTPYPLEVDEDRFFCYFSKYPLTEAEKKERAYITINIDDLFDLATDPTGGMYKTVNSSNGLTPISLAYVYPPMLKFNNNFDGGWNSGNFQYKLGNIMVMRMAEVYLIAAEAALHINSGDGATAANYLNVLRRRACRNAADFNTATGMQLTTAAMDDVFDEYARELCGEFNRWAILKRNKAFENRLQRFNGNAFNYFDNKKHYNRPIPYQFLNQINNPEEFGTNGY